MKRKRPKKVESTKLTLRKYANIMHEYRVGYFELIETLPKQQLLV